MGPCFYIEYNFMVTHSFFNVFFLFDMYDCEITFLNFSIFQIFCEHQHLSGKVHGYCISAGMNIQEVISSLLESPWIVEKEKIF